MPNRELVRSRISPSWRRLRTISVAFAVVLGIGGPMISGAAHATTIVINTTVDEDGTGSRCSLREAIKAANTDAAYGGCPAGSGHDEIFVSLGWGQEIAITRTNPLTITSDLMMDLGSTVMRGSPGSGAFEIAATANATISFLKITGYSGSRPTVRVWGTLYLQYVWIYDNRPAAVPPQTYGVWVDPGGSLYASDCVFRNNTSIKGAGVFNRGFATIENSTFANNTASQYGGAILTTGNDSYMSLDNCTLSGNVATDFFGGGVSIDSAAKMDIFRSTIVNNRAASGGGIYVTSGGQTSLWESIVDGNSRSKSGTMDGCAGVVFSYGSNFVGSNPCALTPFYLPSTDIFGTSAGLGSLAPQWSGGPPVHTPLANSPVLDKIDLNSCGFPGDQLHTARPQGPRCDIGAIERAP